MTDIRHNTEYWLDYYTAHLDQIYSNVSAPKEWFSRLGIDKEKNVIATPQKASPEAIQESKDAWAAVKRDLRIFGLTLSESLVFAPPAGVWAADPKKLPVKPQKKARAKREMMEWVKDPWFTAKHELELMPVRFTGRKAFTAASFFAWWINQTDGRVDPREQTRRILLEQGINAENFHLHADKLAIKNPWA
jgi:hypothetical protein